MVRMGACRVPDRGSIPRRGDFFYQTRWVLFDHHKVEFSVIFKNVT